MEAERVFNRLTLVVLLLVLGLGWLMWSPHGLDEYDGNEDSPMPNAETVAYLVQVKTALQEGNTVRLSEKGLNRYLKSALAPVQSYAINPWVTVRGVYVDLKQDTFTLCIDREIYGQIHQMELTQELISEEVNARKIRTTVNATSGSIGKLKMPTNIVYHLSPWIRTFSDSVDELTKELNPYMGTMKIVDGELLINPISSR